MAQKKNKLEVFKPFVSIVINCFNGEKYLAQALKSIEIQSYKNYEVIFYDNRSTDQSKNICLRKNDERIKYVYANNHTKLYEARKYALQHCRGDLIAFLDVDDQWRHDKLEKQIEAFRDPDLALCYSNYWIAYENLFGLRIPGIFAKIKNVVTEKDLLSNYSVGMLTVMIRKAVLEEFKLEFNEKYHIIGDFDLVIRLSRVAKIGYQPQLLATYRKHAKNESNGNVLLHINELKNWSKENELSVLDQQKITDRIQYLRHVRCISRLGLLSILRIFKWKIFELRYAKQILLKLAR